MKTIIYITERDIDEGARGDCFRCPGALAIRRRLSPWHTVTVSADHVVISYNYKAEENGGRMSDIPTPKRLLRFIRDFDKGGIRLNPCRFTIDIPSEALK